MVTLVCGPPCAGKTTLVRQLAQPDDVVLDFDDICVELGSRHTWAHSQPVRQQADALMRYRMRQLASTPSASGYVIRTAPVAAQRVELARLLGAEVVWVLDPGFAECVRRARSRPRGTVKGIRWWYARYQPSPVDQPCPHLEAQVMDVHDDEPIVTSRQW